MSRILSDVKYSLISFFRNKNTMFWTFLFPVMIMAFMVYVFGGSSTAITLYYTDHDGSATSYAFLNALNGTGAFQLRDGTGMDLAQSLKDGRISIYLEIPSGFGQDIAAARASGSPPENGLHVYYDKSRMTSLPAVAAVGQVADGFSMQMTDAKPLVPVTAQDVATSSMSYVDFVLPGVIGMTIMIVCVNGTVAASAKNRARGVFRKLATTPVTRLEWNAARVLMQVITLLLSVAISLSAAYLLFGVVPAVNAETVLLVVCGGALFAGLGNLIAVFVRDEDTAVNAASMMTFPLMFVSGTFMPSDSMPWFLQGVAAVSPLTYLNNGLRSAMVTGNTGDAFVNLLIVGAIGLVLFTAGVALLKWKDD